MTESFNGPIGAKLAPLYSGHLQFNCPFQAVELLMDLPAGKVELSALYTDYCTPRSVAATKRKRETREGNKSNLPLTRQTLTFVEKI